MAKTATPPSRQDNKPSKTVGASDVHKKAAPARAEAAKDVATATWVQRQLEKAPPLTDGRWQKISRIITR